MKKSIYLADFDENKWPDLRELESYFLTRAGGERTFQEIGNECWTLKVDGAEGTERLEKYKGRVIITLNVTGSLRHGLLLHYQKCGGGYKDTYYSKGDLSRLLRWTETKHGDVMPIGLFIPFEEAWKAIKEFMKRDGALPHSIAWISDSEIPEEAFPDPVRGIPTE
jgi:hypothetical protein